MPKAVFEPKNIAGTGFYDFVVGVEDEGIIKVIFFGPNAGHNINKCVARFKIG